MPGPRGAGNFEAIGDRVDVTPIDSEPLAVDGHQVFMRPLAPERVRIGPVVRGYNCHFPRSGSTKAKFFEWSSQFADR